MLYRQAVCSSGDICHVTHFHTDGSSALSKIALKSIQWEGCCRAAHSARIPNGYPQRFLHMSEAVATEVLAAEPPRDHNDVVPPFLSFEHPKNEHAGSCLAVVVRAQLIAADVPPRIMRSLGRFLVALQFDQKGPSLLTRVAWTARDDILRTLIGNDVAENDHVRWSIRRGSNRIS